MENKFDVDALVLGCTEYSVLQDRRKLDSNPISIPMVDPLVELSIEIARMCYESPG